MNCNFFINLPIYVFCIVKEDNNKFDNSVLIGNSLEIKNFGKGINDLELKLSEKKPISHRKNSVSGSA